MIRGCNEEIIVMFDLVKLGVNVGIIVDNVRVDLGVVGEFVRFFVNLRD